MSAQAEVQPERPKIGFAGVGWIGRSRLEAVAASGVAEIAALADPDRAAGQRAADELAIRPVLLSSFDDLLRQPLDAVAIATPTAFHAEQVEAALNAGLAVFCQKPLGRTAEEVERLVDTAARRDLLLAVDMSYRHTSGMQAVRDLVAGGALGRVFSAHLVFHNAYGPDKSWYRDPELAGGGCLMDLGVHLVDLCLWTLGGPGVLGVTSRLRPQGGQEDHAVLLLDLEGGITAVIECSWNLHAGRDAVIEASFFGTEGGASFRNEGGSFFDFRAERHRGTATEVLAEPPDEWFGRAAADWAARLAAGAGFDDEVRSLVDVAAVLDAAYGR